MTGSPNDMHAPVCDRARHLGFCATPGATVFDPVCSMTVDPASTAHHAGHPDRGGATLSPLRHPAFPHYHGGGQGAVLG